MIPLWKGKNPIYFEVITIIPFDNLYRRAYFVMHTFLVCKDFGLLLVPLSPTNVARYIAILSRRLQYTSIIDYLAIIRLIHLEANFPDPISTHFVHSILSPERNIFHCTKMPAAFTHAKIKIKLTALYNQH
jgi:hypothetical protein